jgi:hypothetical protein
LHFEKVCAEAKGERAVRSNAAISIGSMMACGRLKLATVSLLISVATKWSPENLEVLKKDAMQVVKQ